MKRLCTICVRKGSKGVPNKNIRPLLGKPLLLHTLAQAKISGLFDCISVSSDSTEILALAEAIGALPILRPEHLASDTAAKIPAIQHAAQSSEQLTNTQFDTFVDLDATAPLRTPQHIYEAIQMVESHKASNVLSACPARRSPYFNLLEYHNNQLGPSKPVTPPFIRRQDAPDCFDANASIYVWNRDSLFKTDRLFQTNTQVYLMPEHTAFDIDHQDDFEWVEWLMQRYDYDKPQSLGFKT
jgi:CMP-N,N'-diacetyllegionaminic acid synthase